MTLGTIADITPNSAATQITASTGIIAAWVAVTAVGSSIRVGDVNVASGRGLAIPAGIPFPLPRSNFDQGGYDLSTVYVYGTGSDKVSITYGS